MADFADKLRSFQDRQSELARQAEAEEAQRRELRDAIDAVRCCVAHELPSGIDFYQEFGERLVTLVAILDSRELLVPMLCRLAEESAFDYENMARRAVLEIVNEAQKGQLSEVTRRIRDVAAVETVNSCVSRWLRYDLYEHPTGPICTPSEVVIAGAAPQSSESRLVIDLPTNSATLDGVCYRDIDPTAVRVLKTLQDAQGVHLNSQAVQERTLGCRGNERNLRRAIKRLPDDLGQLIRSRTGKGRWLQLPEQGQ